MDLGCIDMGCIEKQTDETFIHSDNSAKESIKLTSKAGKNKAAKDNSQSNASVLSKFTSQIKKPSHRKSSPLNWFPRKKVDSYLKRKIQLLQEVGGMNSTLDETLGDSNPHYSRVLREKIAVREAAHKAMEARKAAMVEASWCRILRAARIENKEAEALLLKAEKNANEAFEAAKAIGVIMYDIPDCPRKHYKIETSGINGGESTTHTVTASFETAFEVDKQVAAAVKSAFTRLANCPSISKEEFKELLRKISENPDNTDGNKLNNDQELSGYSSECESDTGTELVETMLERLRGLQEDELASLATIVATCGLNAALAKEENIKQEGLGFITIGKKNAEEELPSLDKFLVKRLTRLEREVQEAKNARMKESEERENKNKSHDENIKHEGNLGFTEVPSLDKFLVKHVSRLEREVQEAKNGSKMEKENIDMNKKGNRGYSDEIKETENGLDKIMIKPIHWSKREKVQASDYGIQRQKKENISDCESLDKVLIKRVSRLEKAKMGVDRKEEEAIRMKRRDAKAELEKSEGSLDQILVKHVSRLEREKMEAAAAWELNDKQIAHLATPNTRVEKKSEGSLDQILVKHKSRLEREKMAAAAAQADEPFKPLVGRREARERELQEAWGGLSLGNSVRPHVSRLERDKAAWLKAEEEERTKAIEEQV